MINVHEEEGAEEVDNNYNMIHGEKVTSGAINRKKKKSLYRTTSHASFRSFGGVDDDLTYPLSTFISRRGFIHRR